MPTHLSSMSTEEQLEFYKKECERLEHNSKVEEKKIIKLKCDLQIAKMMYIDDYVREEIDIAIDDGVDQFTINCGHDFYREHKLKFIDEYVIPELTTHTDGDKPYSSYINGQYYHKGCCMSPHKLEYNKDGTMSFTPVEENDD